MNTHSWHDPHIVRAARSLLRALYISLGVFLVFFVIQHIGGALYISSIEKESVEAFHAGIARDLAHLKEQGDAIASSSLLQDYILSRNSEKLIELTK
jgi:hypothetical protein